MKLLAYLFTYPIIWVFSKLPFAILYLKSDFLFLLLYHIIGYRRKVVRGNLELVFSDRSTDELRDIERSFYRHLCDVFVESTKSRSMSATEFSRHYEITNPEVLHAMEEKGSVMVLMTHYANWEWSVFIGHWVKKNKGFGVYQRLANPYFDRYVRRTRARWNLQLIEQREATATILENEQQGIQGVYGLISDQSPMVQKARFWMPFMGITVPVFTGGEYLARQGNMGVLFTKVTKKKRGYYSMEFVPIADRASDMQENEIARRFIQLCEAQILDKPELYFWTHRRWKHRDKVPEEFRS